MLLALSSCHQDQIAGPEGHSLQPVSLSLAVGSAPGTKADIGVITEMAATPVFRGMEAVRMVPFGKPASGDKVTASSVPLAYPLELPSITSLGANNHAVLFGQRYEIPLGTASVLAYGRATREAGSSAVMTKQKNGSLVEVGFDGLASSAGDLRFHPDVMFSSTTAIPEAATTIAGTLTAIVKDVKFAIDAYYGSDGRFKRITIPWDANVGDANLKDCYEQLTAEGRLLPGSGANVGALLTTLYKALQMQSISTAQLKLEVDGVSYDAKYETGDPILYRDIYNGLRDEILKRITVNCVDALYVDEVTPSVYFRDEKVRGYPENMGLPSGAACVRWSPTGYVVPLQNGLDGIAAMSDYCFPPALYYITNTSIKASDQEVTGAYNPDNDWSQILGHYSYGTTVTSNILSVALKEPMQFAVGMLSATVQAEKKDLLDNKLRQITLSANTFPLTGIIIGRQYPQRFDFTPIYSESRQYYLYDNQVSGISLTESESASFSSLVFQTPDEKSVYVCLEFENNSNKTFYGVEDGRIFPGHKFYLVGVLDVPPPTFKDGNGNTVKRKTDSVFKQDYCTSAHFTVQSLKNAYSTIPDMGIPQLAIGVLAQTNWIMSQPVDIFLD